jgi:PAS domain S-box-containing protein
MTENESLQQAPQQASTRRRLHPLLLPLSAAALAIAAVAAAMITLTFESHREQEAARLEAIADLRAGQVESWVREKTNQAEFAGKSPLGEIYVLWIDKGQQDRREFLARRLESLRAATRADAALVLDDSGLRVASPAGAAEPSSTLLQAMRSALDQDAPRFTPLYMPSPQSGLRFEVVAPLTATGRPARAAIVLRFDPEQELLRGLRQWPLPSRTGSAQLVQREGDALIGSYGRTRIPLSTPGLLAAQVVRGDAPAGQAIDANDFGGQPVLGAVQRVGGTPWYLVAKIDRDEAYAEARRDAWWIAAGALLAFGALVATMQGVRARQALRVAQVRQALQAEKLRALQLLGSIADNSSDAIFAKDREGRYILCNAPAAASLGRTVEQVMGQPDVKVLPPNQLAAIKASDAQAMEEGRLVTTELELPASQGPAVYLTTKGPLRDEKGEVVGVFGIARDITELERYRRRLEQLVDERTRELDAKNRSLERTVADLEAFAYSLSHDLRAPLRTISGFASVLLRTEHRALSAGGKQRLDRIVEGAVRMDRMISDILSWAQAERTELRLRDVDLTQVVHEVLQDLEPTYPHTQVDMQSLPVVRADPSAAQQVLANLLGNAFKFSAHSPQPRVQVGQDGQGWLFVRDNGVGFEPGKADGLFQPFHRLHAGNSDYPGTGVGLSIVRRLLERHGGTIRAESQPGQGSTFRFSFGAPATG